MATPQALEDVRVPTRYRLTAMWTTLMFCFIYADYFELYVPGKLQGMLAGNMIPLGPVTQSVLVGTGAMLALPSLMILFSLILGAVLTRWLNIVVATLYMAIQILVISGSGWAFYIAFGVLEVALTALIVWTAWTWPRTVAESSESAQFVRHDLA
ncbi:MAG TPA: DUF6326 family protein [Burkholderiaceae bacterium]|nr:DUF6326 family protein [Burkholderiaceae bacterium]